MKILWTWSLLPYSFGQQSEQNGLGIIDVSHHSLRLATCYFWVLSWSHVYEIIIKNQVHVLLIIYKSCTWLLFKWIPGYPDWWSCTARRSATAQVRASFLSWLGCSFIQDHKLWSEGYHTGMFWRPQLYHYHVSTHKENPSKYLGCWICISLHSFLSWQKLKDLKAIFGLVLWGFL